MDRVEITQSMIGLCHMQVCAVVDATDEEILTICNSQNPSGTSMGWVSVLRNPEDGFFGKGDDLKPKQCQDDPNRLHILVAC
jgi:hypothetical protein